MANERRELLTEGGMTKDELIEDLSERRFGTGFGFGWDALSEQGKEQYRAMVREDWPLIIAFVADWILNYWTSADLLGQQMSQDWREEMV